jgi:hypothetical protein
MKTFNEWLISECSQSKNLAINLEQMAQLASLSLVEFLEKSREAYGSCPLCGQPGVMSSRCINGNIYCAAGHGYPHKEWRKNG